MSDEGHRTDGEPSLRARAEAEAGGRWPDRPSVLPVEETQRLVHDLRVHQIELEMQNEELRRSREMVEEARARYFELYDMAPVGYVTADENGQLTEANLRAATLLQTPRGGLVGQPLTRFVLPEDQDILYLHRRKLLETGAPQVCELRVEQRDTEPLWVRVESTRVLGAEGAGVTWRVTLSDVSETRALQAGLARAERMASMGRLAAGVAHEINNPLTALLLDIENLAEEIPLLVPGAPAGASVRIAELSADARRAVEAAKRIRAATQRLRDFSRVGTVAVGPVDLNLAINDAMGVSANQMACRAMMTAELGSVPRILASRDALTEVFVNLLLNAAEAIIEGDKERHHQTFRAFGARATLSVGGRAPLARPSPDLGSRRAWGGS